MQMPWLSRPIPESWASLGVAERWLVASALAHLAVALLFGVLCLSLERQAILGVHPFTKPAKFAISIALFLLSMACIVDSLSLSGDAKRWIAYLLSSTMILEMLAIGAQAMRGVRSHFNIEGDLNTWIWRTMAAAISVATLTMVWVTWIALRRPLLDTAGVAMIPPQAFAWRAGLSLFLLSAVSGFAMGGRLSHSIGGEDGGPGLPLVNFSLHHGDLRVSHFFSMHALQVFPLLDGLLGFAFAAEARLHILRVTLLLYAVLCVGTLVQAFARRPFLSY